MASTLTTLSVVAFALAAVFLLAAVVFFIVFKIHKVIDYFTNRSAKKKVKKMVNTGASSKINTLQINSRPVAAASQSRAEETTAELKPTAQNRQGSPAKDELETAPLDENAGSDGFAPTEPIASPEPETAMLEPEDTAVLPGQPQQAEKPPRMEMKKLDELVLIHTGDIIP